jgi:hypothetical protein
MFAMTYAIVSTIVDPYIPLGMQKKYTNQTQNDIRNRQKHEAF